MIPFDWHRLWVPHLTPWEVALRATFVYFLAQLLFRVVGRKELSRYGTHDIILLLIVSTSVRQSIVGSDSSLTSAAVALRTIVVGPGHLHPDPGSADGWRRRPRSSLTGAATMFTRRGSAGSAPWARLAGRRTRAGTPPGSPPRR